MELEELSGPPTTESRNMLTSESTRRPARIVSCSPFGSEMDILPKRSAFTVAEKCCETWAN